MSTRFKRRVVIKFLTVENVTLIEIHLKAVYGDDTVDKSTVSQQMSKCRDCKSGNC